jgi:hypothetical protein
MTTLAAVKLIPMPPAFVDRRNTGIDASSVNSSTSVCRTSTAVEPVRIRYLISLSFNTACRISSICVNYKGRHKVGNPLLLTIREPRT